MKASEQAAKALKRASGAAADVPAALRQTGLDGGDLDSVRLLLTKEHHVLTPKEVEALIADYQRGVGVVELGRKYRVHRATVWRHLRGTRSNN